MLVSLFPRSTSLSLIVAAAPWTLLVGPLTLLVKDLLPRPLAMRPRLMLDRLGLPVPLDLLTLDCWKRLVLAVQLEVPAPAKVAAVDKAALLEDKAAFVAAVATFVEAVATVVEAVATVVDVVTVVEAVVTVVDVVVVLADVVVAES